MGGPAPPPIQQAIFCFTSLFALWIGFAAVLGLTFPALFDSLQGAPVARLIALLSFSVGLTTHPADFRKGLQRPRPVLINFVACFSLVPFLGLSLGRLLHVSQEKVIGVLLLSSVNGGSASNLCTLIAGADVALSVLMTASTTLGAAFITPVLAKTLIGATVPVAASAILRSAVTLVLAPTCLGVSANAGVPRLCQAVKPVAPVLALLAGCLIVGSLVASSAEQILNAGTALHLTVALLHILCGAAGYFLSCISGGDEREARTMAIEVAMKNSALACVLASVHFEDPAVRTASAVSCIWSPAFASFLAAYWKMVPEAPKRDEDKAWANGYRA
mmetsp:Transcript_33157/g.72288  ORF Transcript_33157/g.72288 Transcript_33157/m.72288 type:complete len:332 (-) Transcript_33157:127-1122(-)